MLLNLKNNKFIFFLLFSFSVLASEFNVGFNQAWFKSDYGHQWTNPYFDQKEAERILDLNQKAGSKTIRMWLFEGAESTALNWKDGKVVGLNPDFLKNFETFLNLAKAKGIKVYPTLFSPGILDKSTDKATNEKWWNLLNDKHGALDSFKENALKPLMNLLNKPEHQSNIFGIDVANEMDTAVNHDKFENKWTGANKFLCGMKKLINPIPMTASLGWGRTAFVKPNWTPGFSRGAEHIILDPNPHPDCVDFWDIHVYRDSGEITNCEKIKKLTKKYNKKIYLGEFGQDANRFDDQLQKSNAENFIKNAKKCGFSGALAWRVSDVRDGLNPEARYSYEAIEVSQMRPAFEVIRKNNLGEKNTTEKETATSSINDSHLNLNKSDSSDQIDHSINKNK